MRREQFVVVPIALMFGETEKENRELEEMLDRARHFISDFKWCRSIKNEYFGYGIGGILAVFLFEIDPISDQVDEFVWVVVGDIPPAYLTSLENFTWEDALEGYVEEMSKWIEAVEQNQPVDKLIPVNAPSTQAYAELLKTRLAIIKESILPS